MLLFALVPALFALPHACDDTLALRPTLGEGVAYEFENSIVNETQAHGMKFEITVDVTYEIEVTPREVTKEGTLLFDYEFRRVHGRVVGPMLGDVGFDSADPKDEYVGLYGPKILQQVRLGGRTLRLEVARDGRIQKLTGYAEIYAGTELGEMLLKEGDPLTNESHLETAQMLFAIHPTGAIEEGARWETSHDLSLFGVPRVLGADVELEELTRKRGVYSLFGKLEPQAAQASAGSGSEASGSAGLLTGSELTSASIQGNYVVERSSGMLIQGEFERILGIAVPNPFGGDPLPNVVRQRVQMRRLEPDQEPAAKD